MKESKIPAKCTHCDCVGPQRSKAIKAGWVNFTRRGNEAPVWVCAQCTAVDKIEREQQAEILREAERETHMKMSPQLRSALALAYMMGAGRLR